MAEVWGFAWLRVPAIALVFARALARLSTRLSASRGGGIPEAVLVLRVRAIGVLMLASWVLFHLCGTAIRELTTF